MKAKRKLGMLKIACWAALCGLTVGLIKETGWIFDYGSYLVGALATSIAYLGCEDWY